MDWLWTRTPDVLRCLSYRFMGGIITMLVARTSLRLHLSRGVVWAAGVQAGCHYDSNNFSCRRHDGVTVMEVYLRKRPQEHWFKKEFYKIRLRNSIDKLRGLSSSLVSNESLDDRSVRLNPIISSSDMLFSEVYFPQFPPQGSSVTIIRLSLYRLS